VQGVQGTKRPTMHSCKPRRARPCALLCRVCRVSLYTRARISVLQFSILRARLARIYPPAHPAHPAHALILMVCSCAWYFSHPCTPCTIHLFLKKMQKIICGKENLKEFTAEFKATVPVFYDAVKELYASGLVPGLRGATLEYFPLSEPIHESTPELTPEYQCQQCQQWLRDVLGDGLGIGQCLINSRSDQLKWPKQTACKQFTAI